MNEDFKQYLIARCEKALTENKDYARLQSDSLLAIENKDFGSYAKIAAESEAKVEELCYMQGFNDAMQLIMNSRLPENKSCVYAL